jgi:prophage DNA circulation protein
MGGGTLVHPLEGHVEVVVHDLQVGVEEAALLRG